MPPSQHNDVPQCLQSMGCKEHKEQLAHISREIEGEECKCQLEFLPVNDETTDSVHQTDGELATMTF